MQYKKTGRETKEQEEKWPNLPFRDLLVRSHDGVLDVDGVVAHPAQHQRLVKSSDNENGVVIIWNVKARSFINDDCITADNVKLNDKYYSSLFFFSFNHTETRTL